MPKFIQLSKEDVAGLKKISTVDLTPYKEYLSKALELGYGAIELEEGETSRVAKRRLSIAAKESDLQLKWKKSTDSRLVFAVNAISAEKVKRTPKVKATSAP